MTLLQSTRKRRRKRSSKLRKTIMLMTPKEVTPLKKKMIQPARRMKLAATALPLARRKTIIPPSV